MGKRRSLKKPKEERERMLLRKKNDNIIIRVILYDGGSYGNKIYDYEADIMQSPHIIEAIEQKTGINLFDEYIRYKFRKADEDLANYIRTLKVKFGMVK